MLDLLEHDAALQHTLATMEVSRKKIAAYQIKGYGFIAAGLVFMIIGYVTGQVEIGILAGMAPLIFGGLKLYQIRNESTGYKQAYKSEIIGTILRHFDSSLKLEPAAGISEHEFVSSGLFSQEPDRYHTEDLVTGNAGQTGFYFAEVHAEYKTEVQTKSGKQTQWHDIFKGIIFVADFNKNFNGVTIVKPKDWASAFGAWFSKHVLSVGNSKVIQLENPEFTKCFVTYGTDQVESRYILTPALMERILELNSRASYMISLSFTASRMYIAFPLLRDYFEAPVFKSLIHSSSLEEDINTIRFMYGIIQELDLNTRIWGKQ